MKNIEQHYDIVIVGTGIGGATVLSALVDTGASILVLERGEQLPDTAAARDAQAVFVDQSFKSDEQWRDVNGKLFAPGNYYYLGGNSKFYGAVMLRYRERDFSALKFEGGVSPAWPFSYTEFAPFYRAAETLYQVRGTVGEDSSDPGGERGYIEGPVPDEPCIARLRQKLLDKGYHPFSLPLAVDIERWLARSQTPWDGFPDTGTGKIDAQAAALTPALEHDNVTLISGAKVSRLQVSECGKRIKSVEFEKAGQQLSVSATLVILSAGAINSAALLLASKCARFPKGLSNSSDQVGRNFMNHNCSALLAINPFRRNRAVYQKTIAVNDYYFGDEPSGEPLGNIQLLGKLNGSILKAGLPAKFRWLPTFVLNWLANHSVDWYVMSEDLPNPESRVSLDDDGCIRLSWQRSNMSAHNKLLSRAKKMARATGYPFLLSKPFDSSVPSHQCGTVRMGIDPALAPLDSYCRSYDQRNLFVVDASFLPNSAAVNPALTIAAQALRVAEHIKTTETF